MSKIKAVWPFALLLVAVGLFVALRSGWSSGFQHAEAERNDLDSPDQAYKWRRLTWLDENGTIAPGALRKAAAQRQAILDAGRHSRLAGDYWVERGPDNLSGRNRCLLINPANPSIMWQGTAGGGIWRSTDGGATWNASSDNFGSLAVGTLVMDPANSNVIYAGTGEGYFNQDSLQGVGIYKSTDGGLTWNVLPATTSFGNVTRIAIAPNNSSIVLAATQPGGIRRSTDGGATWNPVHVAQAGQSLAFSTGNPNNVIAGILDYDSSTSQVYSVMAYSTDAGATWTRTNTRVNGFGEYEVTFAGNSATLCYASGPSSSSSSQVVCLKSTDGGQTWSAVGTLNGSGQNWYDNCIWLDPTNPNLVVIGDTRIWRSTDGGANFSSINGNGYIQTTIAHPDIHGITPSPNYNGGSNRQVYFSTDGGIYLASDITTVSGTSSSGWTRLDRNIHSSQYYYAAGDGGTGRIMGGLQDNGTQMLLPGSTQSFYPFGGDGGDVAIDYASPDYAYGEYVYLQIWRSTNGGTTQNSGAYIVSGLSDAGTKNTNFISPFVIDPNTPTTILGGGGSLWRCTNARAATPTWASIKPAIASDPISAVAIAKGNSDLVWVANNHGEVFKTLNGTSASPAWTTIDDNGPSNPLPNRYPRSILIDPDNSNVVYFVFGGFTPDNVWRTTDGGISWNSIMGNLPQAPIHAIARNPADPNKLYVGTEVGLFSTANGGVTWTTSSDMVGNCPVFDLRYMNNSSTLIAATHGRGIWVLQGQLLSGHVALSQYTGDVTQPALMVEILDSGNNVVQSTPLHLDASGNFQMNSFVVPGTYNVRIKGTNRFLRKLITGVTFTVAGASGLSATLRNGDVDGNNSVGLGDFSQLKLAFGSVPGDANWNANADLDGNGSVGLGDFAILKANFGAIGD